MKIGLIGIGKMGEALIASFLGKGLAKKEEIFCSDISDERRNYVKKKFGISVAKNNSEVVKKAEIVFLSIKPQQMHQVLDEIKDFVAEKHLIISIAAGIKIGTIESKLRMARVIRVMPNTPCIVGEAMSCYALGKKVTEEDKSLAEILFNSFGKSLLLEEELLDVVTALSGSGPAFLAVVLDSMAKAGIKEGLKKEDAYLMAYQTALGTGKLLLEKGITTDELIKMVATPGGTCEQGLNVMNSSDIREILQKAIKAATERSKELGGNG